MDAATINNQQTSKFTNEPVEVVSCTLEDLLLVQQKPLPSKSITGHISIPEYQRPYVWKERQVNKLLNDLAEHAKLPVAERPLYYLGSIILHQDGDKLHIIDGQQRLTTLLILNSFLRYKVNANIAYHLPESIENIRHVHSYLKAIANGEVPAFADIHFEDIVCLAQINVTLIVTQSEDLAYTFFETQNTGGVRLSGPDIAKAHHLRAIDSNKTIAYQARRWEHWPPQKIEHCIKNLIKVRYWNFKSWQAFPLYRDERSIKETIIDEFTERTVHQAEDLSFYYALVQKQGHHAFQMNESPFRHIRQPLYDGNNFLDYIQEYLELHDILFQSSSDHRLPDPFILFRNQLLHGRDGTVFLKELYEILLTAYVSRFGFERLFEAGLWLYRYVYSLRVSMARNVREDSIFAFARAQMIVDKILYAYTINEVLDELKQFRYGFDTANTEEGQSKAKHVQSVTRYFHLQGIDTFSSAKEMCTNNLFDKALVSGIYTLLKQNKHG
ncbi:hypothetical protein BUE76_01425 [Cnuella takakiae]|nr:hypothetical protein BUE76_01425 [Cnuella takakiae]